MKKRKDIIAIFILIGVVGFAIAGLVLNGTTSYDSTDENITQETGFAHLNLSDADLILYYPFDFNSSSGQVYDYSNNSNTGTMRNFADNHTVDGIYGGAYEFNGVNTSINLNDFTDLDGTSTFAISMWIYKRTEGNFVTHEGLFCRGDTDQRTPWIYGPIGNQFLSGYFETDDGVNDCVVGSPNLIAHSWNHIVFNWNGTSCWFVVNNVVGNKDPTGGSVLASTNGYNNIGKMTGYGFWNGSIDEVMVFNRSLSSTEITAIYNNQSQRFYSTGEMLFENNNLGTNDTMNISLAGCINNIAESYVQAKINNGDYQNFSSCNLTNYFAEGNLTAANLTLKFDANSYGFYSPLISGNITLTSWDSAPNVNITSPVSGSTSTSSSISINVTTNQNSTCNYSTNSGATNSSLTSNSTGTGHTGTKTGLANGNYVLNIYCADLQGNANNTENVSFTIAVPAATTTEEESPGTWRGTFNPSQNSLENGYSVNLGVNQKVEINFGNFSKKTFAIKEISNSENEIIVSVNDEDYEINVSGNIKIDLDNDGFYDVEVSNNKITGNYVNLEFKLINEPVSASEQEQQNENVNVNGNNSGISFWKKIGNFFGKIWDAIIFWK